jgi:hypothetical protein
MPHRVGVDAACVRSVDTHTNYIARFHRCRNANSVRPCAWWQLRPGRTSESPGSGGVSQRSDKRVSHQFVRERSENSVSASRVQGPPHPFFAGYRSVAEKCRCRGEPDSAIGSKPSHSAIWRPETGSSMTIERPACPNDSTERRGARSAPGTSQPYRPQRARSVVGGEAAISQTT